ncbi:MAG TPA: glycosyltransferase family 2 protein [bacterium]|nr:glycosyltransferase family 2 protein [bacterium]
MIHIVLPAYNEAASIGALLRRIGETMQESGLPYRVLVVDDGSSDATAAVARGFAPQLPVAVVAREQNGGLAEAMRSGFAAALDDCAERDIVIVMDADNTHNPELMLRMIRMIREGNDVVIASRYQRGGRVVGVSALRQVMSSGASLLCRLLFPIRNVRDYTCGYRAYAGAILRAAQEQYGDRFIEERGFSCMVDILLKLRGLDAIMDEAPLILRYDHKRGASKMNVGGTVTATLTLLLRRRLRGC